MSDKLACFSDVHMGIGDARDDFTQDLRLITWLHQQREQDRRIVGVGDLVDIVQVRERGEAAQSALARVEAAHPALTEALCECMDIYVRGNHEADLRYGFGCPVVEAVQIDGLLVAHGHQFDMFNHGWLRPVGDAATRLAGTLEYVHPDADHWLAKGLAWTCGRGRYGSKESYAKLWWKVVNSDPALRGGIGGHTHKADQQDGHYWNCGTWTGDRHDSVVVTVNQYAKPIILEAVT